ncbi:MAG: Gfo/Idh/MocA family oxidoreductase [Planctomycetaceae bacterium]|nr:Gfo/Idh/MocA family oxidoreductase [Planctomycetaceae bacterium]
MVNKTSRRDFIKTSAAVTGLGFWVAAGNSLKAQDSPNEKLGIAAVGVGGKGSSDIDNAAKWGTVVGLCDVDRGRLRSKRRGAFQQAEIFTDFREMLEKLDKQIDVVVVSTPDHMHAPAALMAMRMKKHMYVQKPLTRTIYEARMMGKVAAENGVCTQMGNQGSAFPNARKYIQQVRKGLLGNIKEVHVWTNRPIWPQGVDRQTIDTYRAEAEASGGDVDEMVAAKKADMAKDLENLDWELWIGAGKFRDYYPGQYHDFRWRGWWDFGSGALGDMACHTFNMPYYACDLRNPTSVQAISSGHNFDSFPARSKIFFEFPATDLRPYPTKATWYDGGNLPDAALLNDYGFENPRISGALIIGEKGALYTFDDYCQTCSLSKGLEDLPDVEWRPNSFIDEIGNNDVSHSMELFEAIQKNDPSLCFSNYTANGGPLTETILLGNLAVWAASKENEMGEKIEWDAVNLKVTNNVQTPGVVDLIKPVYRECNGRGYQLD